MRIDIHSIAAEASAGLRKFKAVADAVAGSPVTREMERLVPGLARFVGDAEAVAGVAGTLANALPALPAVLGVIDGLHALGARPMDAANSILLDRERDLQR